MVCWHLENYKYKYTVGFENTKSEQSLSNPISHWMEEIFQQYTVSIFRAENTLLPFEHCAGISLLIYASHHATVFQSHALQQPVVHIIPNPYGEDAELFLHSWASVPQNRHRLGLPDSWPSVRQENDEGDAVCAGIRTWEVITKQRRARLNGAIDVRACSRGTPMEFIQWKFRN